MKKKLLNAALILTSLMAYLEWGGDNRMFLFQGEWEILTKLFNDPMSVLHPFTLVPLVGQLLMLATLFQKQVSSVLTFIGMSGMGLLLLFMFVIGIMGLNYLITLSVFPFLLVAVLTVREHWRGRNTSAGS